MDREESKNKHGIVGNSKQVNDLVDVVNQIADSDITILIYGESGVGKEVFAKAIHESSRRAGKPLVSVNCGAIPEGILESELFGHKKGSFTGATEHRKGYFEIADGGTLFLDEIGEMPLTTQVKVLRAIESKEFMKIGAETVTKVNLRIIAATNKNLQEEVDAKRFREDLFFRLKAVSLSIPPLRKRRSDIEELTLTFINNYSAENKITPPKVTPEAMEVLKEYNWPGNVRELKNTIETAIVLNKDGVIDLHSLSSLFVQQEDVDRSRNLPVFLRKSPEEADREILYRALFEIKKDLVDLKDLIIHQHDEVFERNKKEESNTILPLNEMEKEAIINALDKTRGSKRKAAKMLNISERTLYRKIKEYNIQ